VLEVVKQGPHCGPDQSHAHAVKIELSQKVIGLGNIDLRTCYRSLKFWQLSQLLDQMRHRVKLKDLGCGLRSIKFFF
jgi:hypothetical protein